MYLERRVTYERSLAVGALVRPFAAVLEAMFFQRLGRSERRPAVGTAEGLLTAVCPHVLYTETCFFQFLALVSVVRQPLAALLGNREIKIAAVSYHKPKCKSNHIR